MLDKSFKVIHLAQVLQEQGVENMKRSRAPDFVGKRFDGGGLDSQGIMSHVQGITTSTLHLLDIYICPFFLSVVIINIFVVVCHLQNDYAIYVRG